MSDETEKIIAHIGGDATSRDSTSFTISTIGALPASETLDDWTWFEIIQYTRPDNATSTSGGQTSHQLTSKKVSWATMMSKFQAGERSAFDAVYQESKNTTFQNSGITKSFAALISDATGWTTADDTAYEKAPNTPLVWNDVWTLAIGEERLAENVKGLKTRMDEMDVSKTMYSPTMQFQTTINTVQQNGQIEPSVSTETMAQAYSNPNSGINSDGFVVAFLKGSRTTNEFVCPFDGMLTLYGWVDSSNVPNVKYLPTAWCALKGKINGRWEILNLQPVVPEKQFSYVGFCVPVKAGLSIQLELGFTPGEASGRYDKTVDSMSLANTRPNAFLGGVFKMK